MPECSIRNDGECNFFDIDSKPKCGSCSIALVRMARLIGEMGIEKGYRQLINSGGKLVLKVLNRDYPSIGHNQAHWKSVAKIEAGKLVMKGENPA